MTDTAPLVHVIERTVPAVGAAADAEVNLGVVPFAGTITAVKYVPDTVLTGANTETRTGLVKNKGQAGAGTTTAASKAFTAGVNAAADTPTSITLSAVSGATTVAANDVLAWQSTHSGSTGLADPGGILHVEITRG